MVVVYPTTAGVDTSAQAAVLDATDNSYSLLYFDTQGVCNPTRNMLALTGATWKQLYPQDWDDEDKDHPDKTSTPFEVLPVLYVHSKSGETVALAETRNIEHYLAKKTSLLGQNSYEEHLISSFVSSTATLVDSLVATAMKLEAPPEVKQNLITTFLTKKIPQWIRIHEAHLQSNGNNGHYVGSTLSLADLRTHAFLVILLRFPMGPQLVNAEATPGLFKLKQGIDQHPVLAKWQQTDLAKSLRPSRASPALPHAPGVGVNDRKGNKTAPVA